STNVVTGWIKLTWFPMFMAINRAGTQLFVTKDGGTFAIIDTATNTVVEEKAGAGREGIAILPNNSKVYATKQTGGHSQGLLMGYSAAPPFTFSGGLADIDTPWQVAAHPDSSKVYVDSAGGLLAVDVATNSRLATSTGFGLGNVGIAVHPKGT